MSLWDTGVLPTLCSGSSQPSPALPSHQDLCSQPTPVQMLSPLVNIDLHIRLNIDIGAGSLFPTRASKPETATWKHTDLGPT